MHPQFIVSDAGPLIALSIAGVLAECISMLGGMHVPEAVLQECLHDPFAPGAAEIASLHAANRFQIVPQSLLTPLDAAYAQGLGSGELAVLSYAAEHQLLALIDERRTRRIAQRLNIAIIGSGTLVANLKQLRYIPKLESVFDAWQKHGYFVAEAVKRDIVKFSAK